jgi:hypothetical protein
VRKKYPVIDKESNLAAKITKIAIDFSGFQTERPKLTGNPAKTKYSEKMARLWYAEDSYFAQI